MWNINRPRRRPHKTTSYIVNDNIYTILKCNFIILYMFSQIDVRTISTEIVFLLFAKNNKLFFIVHLTYSSKTS